MENYKNNVTGKNNTFEKAEKLLKEDKKLNKEQEGKREDLGGKVKLSSVKGKTPKEKALIERQKKEEKKARERIEKATLKKEKKEAIKQLKIRKKEERLARRDLLKHESKAQRADRKLREKRDRELGERKRREQLAFIKAEKVKAREEKRKAMEREKMERKNAKRQRGLGGWITAVSCLGVVTLALATMLVYNMFMPGSTTKSLSSTYSRNFYELCDYVDNIDVNLSKLQISEDNGNRQKILTNIIVQANLAEENLSALPIREDSRSSTIKFINQLGDFSKYLNNKIIDGSSPDERDKNNIVKFKEINGNLKDHLCSLNEKMGYNFNFATLISGEENNIILNEFSEIEYNSVEYPKMIYDGPFADKDEDKVNHGEKGEPIKEEQALEIAKNAFSDYGVKEFKMCGSAEGEDFNIFNIEGTGENGELYIQVTDQGKIVMFDLFNDCKDDNFDRDKCIENAYKNLDKWGYSTVKPVWTTTNDNIVYINFASFNNDGVIFYSDLIKVSVCKSDGKVCDMDATQYVKNHRERNVPIPKLKVESAEKKICANLEVETSRLALIPLDNGKEVLAYEFFGRADDGSYYVYIDALTGKEVKIFKVIETSKGTLLL